MHRRTLILIGSSSLLTCSALTLPLHAEAFRLVPSSEILPLAIDPLARDAASQATVTPTQPQQEVTAANAPPQASEPSVLSAPSAKQFGDADSTQFEVIAQVATDFHGTTLGLVDVGVNWFVASSVSFGLFAEGAYASQSPDDALGGGGGVLVRWHFVREEKLSLFAEAGCGLLFFDNPVPTNGSESNFTPRASFGAAFALSDSTRLVARIGWLHLSNAQTDSTNPGLDTLAVGLGLSFEF